MTATEPPALHKPSRVVCPLSRRNQLRACPAAFSRCSVCRLQPELTIACPVECSAVARCLMVHIEQEPAHFIEEGIWMGDKRAAYPTFATQIGKTAQP